MSGIIYDIIILLRPNLAGQKSREKLCLRASGFYCAERDVEKSRGKIPKFEILILIIFHL